MFVPKQLAAVGARGAEQFSASAKRLSLAPKAGECANPVAAGDAGACAHSTPPRQRAGSVDPSGPAWRDSSSRVTGRHT